jgi:hypothetical protein
VIDTGNCVSYTTVMPGDDTMTLVEQVRKHAEARYDRDGWDFLVECWEDHDIAEWIGDAADFETAMERCRHVTRALDDNRRQCRASADW